MDKIPLLEQCYQILRDRILQIETALHAAQIALQEETKSSAGDKYETAREMIQQDLDRLERQRRIVIQERLVLDRIAAQKAESTLVGLGSIVYADDGMIYFIAVGLGKIRAEDRDVYAVSFSSPISKLLQTKKKNDFFEINRVTRKIINVI